MTATKEFRHTLALTAVGLSVPAVVELAIGFSGHAGEGVALFMVPLFGVCLIVLAGILAGLLALAGYGRQARGVGAGVGLLSLAAAIGLVVWTHSV